MCWWKVSSKVKAELKKINGVSLAIWRAMSRLIKEAFRRSSWNAQLNIRDACPYDGHGGLHGLDKKSTSWQTHNLIDNESGFRKDLKPTQVEYQAGVLSIWCGHGSYGVCIALKARWSSDWQIPNRLTKRLGIQNQSKQVRLPIWTGEWQLICGRDPQLVLCSYDHGIDAQL